MNGFPAWLETQVHVLGSIAAAVVSDQPEPARQVLIYTAALALIIWAFLKIAKLVSK